ncbi:probable serine hydrolase [Leptinotarsa decemlineata]|uniref:probable serine hydrolase n=1 Tax=Leptinotarsa decemlineata TaxID=7539 RepID=UPI000C252D74|nr:probable serine hydrolase [Leptinotarsa decemlineata]
MEAKNTVKADFTELKIPVPWGHIAGKWWGSRNEQPIIALHGWLDNCGSFDNLAPLLVQKGFSLLCIDLPGHGFSSHLPKGQYYYLIFDGVHYLRRIVKRFGWREITIIGHSLGGSIAFLYAATFPKDVKKYISLDMAGPCGRLDSGRFLEYFRTSIENGLDNETTGEWPTYSKDQLLNIFLMAFDGSVNRAGCEVLLRRGIKKASNKEGYILSRDPRLKDSGLEFMPISQVLDIAPRITCEVLNIRSDAISKSYHPEYYFMILDAIEKNSRKLERHLLSGSEHYLHLMNANEIAPIIIKFLISQ